MAMTDEVLSTPGHLISLAARAFARLSELRLKPLGLGVGYLPVLVALRDGQAGTQAELARTARTGQPPMAQMLVRMERDGLIKRMPDPTDGRRARVILTDAARKRMPDAIAVLLAGNAQALEGFSEREALQLEDLLKRVIVNLDGIAQA